MENNIEVVVREFDERSSQFSCELTISNPGAEAFEVIAVSPRIPKGLWLNEASGASEMELLQRHRTLCMRLEDMIGAFLAAHSQEEATAFAQRLQESVRKVFTTRGMIRVYGAMLTGRGPKVFEEMRTRLARLPITTAAEAQRALAILKNCSPSPVEVQSAEYIVDTLQEIEQKSDFEASRRAGSVVQPGQQQKSIYVVQATRGMLGLKSYCVNFSVGLRSADGEKHVSRMESVSLSVSPNPFSLTVLAIASSAAGAAIRYLVAMPEGTPAAHIITQWPSFIVAALTALVMFNIFDLTNLREQLRSPATWRGAILIGFLCGYLNNRILAAVEALLGTS